MGTSLTAMTEIIDMSRIATSAPGGFPAVCKGGESGVATGGGLQGQAPRVLRGGEAGEGRGRAGGRASEEHAVLGTSAPPT